MNLRLELGPPGGDAGAPAWMRACALAGALTMALPLMPPTMVATFPGALPGGPATLAAQQVEDPAARAWNAGDHATARNLYAVRVAADSADIQALHRLGLLLAWDRQYDAAIPLLERLVALAPGVTTRGDLARVLSWAGRYDAALAQYAAVLDAAPGNADALLGVARVTSWRGDLAAGVVLWRRLVALNPDDADARMGLSQVLRWRGAAREALQHAEAAARLRPDDREVLDQLAWAETAFAPRLAPTFSAEVDSDDNRLYTAGLSASAHVSPRVALLVNGHVRRADGPTPFGVSAVQRESRMVAAGVRVEVGTGWTVSGVAGASDRSAGTSGAAAVYRVGVATPTWLPVTGSLNHARSALDATADLMGRDILTDEGSLGVAVGLGPSVRLEAGGALTRFHGTVVNDRVLGRLGLDARVSPWLRVRPRATAFRFEHSVQEGYFAPDEYVLGEVGLGVDRHRAAWSFSGEVAPGAQRIGSAGEVKGAVSGRARVGYTLAPGREVGVSFAFSNLGIERVQAGGAGYRYQAAVVSAAWGF